MIQCKDVTEEANDYINGDLPLTKRIGLFMHLMICRCCRNYMQQLHRTIDMITILHPKEKETTDISELAKKLHDINCPHH